MINPTGGAELRKGGNGSSVIFSNGTGEPACGVLRRSHPAELRHVRASMACIERQKTSSSAKVLQFRISAEMEEEERREEAQQRRRERLELRQRGQEARSRLAARIKGQWDVPQKETDLGEARNALIQQQEWCAEMIQSKTDLIQDYSYYRRDKHSSWVRDRGTALELLQRTVNEELSEMRRVFDEELETIERALMDERARLVDSNRDELAKMEEERRRVEASQLPSARARWDEARLAEETARRNGAEGLMGLKLGLERKVCELGRKLERSRAMYEVHSDKLDYNLRVLTESNAERAVEIKKQKKCLVGSKEGFHTRRDRYLEAEERDARKVKLLARDCAGLQERNERLIQKARRFARNDEAMYQEMLAMHTDELSQLANKMRRCEERIAGAFGVQASVPGGGGWRSTSISAPSSTSATATASSESGSEPDGQQDGLALLAGAVTEETIAAWVQLEKVLTQRQGLLEEKVRKSREMGRLKGENARTLALAEECASAEAARSLICPPSC